MKKLLACFVVPGLLFVMSCGKDSRNEYVIDCTFDKELKKNDVSVPDSEKTILRNFIAENGIEATEHPAGFFYKIHKPGEETKLEKCYEVSVTYKCYTLDGHYIDFGTHVPFTLYAETTILGFRMGMTTVGKGGEVTLYLPPSLAYGEKGADPAIAPGEYLIFDVSIVDARKRMTSY